MRSVVLFIPEHLIDVFKSFAADKKKPDKIGLFPCLVMTTTKSPEQIFIQQVIYFQFNWIIFSLEYTLFTLSQGIGSIDTPASFARW